MCFCAFAQCAHTSQNQSEVTDINKQKFLAELGKLLTFMYDEDRQAALEAYSRMFDNARDEQLLLQFLVSPTRQAVVIARAYTARERKLQVSSPSRDGSIDDAASRDFMRVLEELEDEAVAKNIIVPEVPADQLSLFGDEPQPAEAKAPNFGGFTEDILPPRAEKPAKPEFSVGSPERPAVAAEPAQAAETVKPVEPAAKPEQAAPFERAAADAPTAPQKSTAAADAVEPDEAELNIVEPDAVETKPEPAAEAKTEPVVEIEAEPEAVELEGEDVSGFLADFGTANDKPSADSELAPPPKPDAEDESRSGDKVDSFLADFGIVNDELDGSTRAAQGASGGRLAKRRAEKGLPAKRDEKPERVTILPAERASGTETVDITVKKPVVPLLVLYTILAVPVVLLCVALLLIPTLLCLAVSALAVMVGCAALISAFGAFTMFSDMMVVLGAAMLTLALGLLFLWFFVWLIGGAIAGLINAVIKLGGKWCYKEVPAV